MITPSVPGAADETWTTPARPPGPVVSPVVPTNEVAPGGQPIVFPGNPDAGGRDTVASTVAGAVANAEARYREHQADTYGQGSTIGDALSLPEVPAYRLPPPPASGYPWPGDEPVPA
jgi:hypothetical protein